MSMKISGLINRLQDAMQKHGDLPVYTQEADVSRVEISPQRDGIVRITDGKQEEPNELYIEFIPE